MTTRTKEREFETQVVGEGGFTRRYSIHSGLPTASAVPTATTNHTNVERICYELGSRHAYKSKNCKHEVLIEEYYPLTGYRYLDSDEDFLYDGVSWNGFMRTGDYLMSSIEPGEATIASFNAEAFEAMKPSFEGDLQLTNFLLELLDLKQILSLAGRWGSMIKSFHAYLDLLRRSGGGKISAATALKATAVEIASGHLTWSFGIKPFIGDVMKMYAMLSEWSQRISDFLNRRGVPQVRHYSKTILNDEGVTDSSLGPSSRGHVTYTRSVKMFATMRYIYDCPDIVTFGQKLDVFRDSLGLRFGLPQLWEAIPFSFVVDWFYRVGDWLEQNQEPLFPVKLTVNDYCVSYKCKIDTSGLFELQGARLGPDPYFQGIGTKSHRKYVRERQLPSSGATFINSGHYGQNQLALSASLLTCLSSRRGSR